MINGSDGGYIMAGHTASFGAGASDAWVVKVDKEGNHLWNRTYGGTSMDVVFSIIETIDGGYALTGLTESFGMGQWDAWLIKIDSTGQIQWNQTYGGAERDYGGSLAITPDGGYVVCGYTESNSLGERDYYLVKTDNLGNLLWERTYGGYTSDRACSVIVTPDEGFLLVGTTESLCIGTQDVWIVKTDSNGIQLWNRTIGGSNVDIPYAAISSSDGGLIITGRTESFGAGKSDAWLLKLDENGFHEWNRTFGGLEHDYATSIISTHDGGYAMAGRTESFGKGSEDMWLIKTNSSGDLEFNQTFGGINAEAAYSVIENGNQGFIIAGRTSSYGVGAEDIWFLTTAFESNKNTISGFSTSVTIISIMTVVIIRVRKENKTKK
jgi:hypothetical protein